MSSWIRNLVWMSVGVVCLCVTLLMYDNSQNEVDTVNIVKNVRSSNSHMTITSRTEASTEDDTNEGTKGAKLGGGAVAGSGDHGNNDDWIWITQGTCEAANWPYPGPSWSNCGGYVHGRGCGFCATYMAAQHYTGNANVWTLEKVYNEFKEKGYYTTQGGGAAGVQPFFESHKEEMGLDHIDYAIYCNWTGAGPRPDLDKVDECLKTGGCVICTMNSITYNGHHIWTSGSHYVIIISGNQKKGYSTLDSAGGHNTPEGVGYTGVAEWGPYDKGDKIPAEYLDGGMQHATFLYAK